MASTDFRSATLFRTQPDPTEEESNFIHLDKPKVTIGRSAASDQRLASTTVSRFHALFSFVNGNWRIYDQNSATGTFVNERRIIGETGVELNHGDHLSFGTIMFSFLEDHTPTRDDPQADTFHPETSTSGNVTIAVAASNFESILSELTCSVCSEYFMAPHILNCSHSFCKFCLTKWSREYLRKNLSKNVAICPICRQSISSVVHNLSLENVIKSILELAIEKKELLEWKNSSEKRIRINGDGPVVFKRIQPSQPNSRIYSLELFGAFGAPITEGGVVIPDLHFHEDFVDSDDDDDDDNDDYASLNGDATASDSETDDDHRASITSMMDVDDDDGVVDQSQGFFSIDQVTDNDTEESDNEEQPRRPMRARGRINNNVIDTSASEESASEGSDREELVMRTRASNVPRQGRRTTRTTRSESTTHHVDVIHSISYTTPTRRQSGQNGGRRSESGGSNRRTTQERYGAARHQANIGATLRAHPYNRLARRGGGNRNRN